MRNNVTKYFRDVLPKISGYRFEVSYDTSYYPRLGNIKVYLWEPWYKGMNIVGSAYADVATSDNHEQVRVIVANAAAKALADAERKGFTPKNGVPAVPKNITGKW